MNQDGAGLVIPHDVHELRRLIEESDAKLVIVDPLDEFTDAAVDGWKAKAVAMPWPQRARSRRTPERRCWPSDT